MIEIVTESNRIESFLLLPRNVELSLYLKIIVSATASNAFYLRHTQPCTHCWSLARHVHNYVPVAKGGSPYDERNVQGLCAYHYEWAVTNVQPKR